MEPEQAQAHVQMGRRLDTIQLVGRHSRRQKAHAYADGTGKQSRRSLHVPSPPPPSQKNKHDNTGHIPITNTMTTLLQHNAKCKMNIYTG